MKRPTLVSSLALLIAACSAQAQNPQLEKQLSDWEFRQTLMDLGSYLDAHKGTELRRQFETMPEEYLRQVHVAMPNILRFQEAVKALRKHDENLAAERLSNPIAVAPASLSLAAMYPSCPADTIIDTSVGSTCTPAYADPTNTAWRNLVNPLITFGAFSPTNYSAVSSQACGLTVEANLSQVSAALQGTVLAASAICSAIPAPGSNVCWGVNAIFSIADATSFGLFADCQEQDGLVQSAEVNAAFHNTVTIYNNLKSMDTHLTNVNTDIDTRLTNLGTQVTGVSTQVSGVSTQVSNLSTQLTNANNQISSEFTALDTHLTNVNNQVTSEFTAADTHLTNVDNHVASEFTALSAQLTTLFNQLTTQVNQTTALLNADQRQVMKLLLEPDGLKVINPAILTCTGTNCPNVLANCPAAGCSWNNIGPLP